MRPLTMCIPAVAAVLVLTSSSPAATVSLKMEPATGTTVFPGETVSYQVKCSVSAGDNQGLMTIGFDVQTDTDVAQTHLTKGPLMDNFETPYGFTNPNGFGGTPDPATPGNILGVGGAQNTIGNDGVAPNPSYPSGTVTTGLGQPAEGNETGEIVIATGQIIVPQQPGTYHVNLANAIAGVLPTGATVPCAVQVVTPNLATAGFDVVVSPIKVVPGAVPEFVYETWPVSLTCSATEVTGAAVTYAWTQTAGRTVSDLTYDANTGTASFTVPTLELTIDVPLKFTVTASANGHQASKEVTVNAYIMGDVDHDGRVISADLKVLVDAWNTTPGMPKWNAAADLDGDDSVISADLRLLYVNWNRFLGSVAVTLTGIPSYTYEGRTVGLGCTVRSIHGDTPSYTWTQTYGASVIDPSGASTANYSFTVPTLASSTDVPLSFRLSVSAGQDGNMTKTFSFYPYMIGDVNHDNCVDDYDTDAVTAAWGTYPGQTNWDPWADLNSDGTIGQADQDLVDDNMDRCLDDGMQQMSTDWNESAAVSNLQTDSSVAEPNTTGPVDASGLTFEQALQQVGLLEVWLNYLNTQGESQ